MFNFPPTIILRHKRENLKKCSLRGLENREDFIFLTYPLPILPNLDHYLILTIDAPELTLSDADRGIFLIDGTWRYAKTMAKMIGPPGHTVYRSIPASIVTAYPRRQLDCPEPTRGLASIEALHIAYTILERPTQGILDHYHWKNEFLKKNDKIE